MERRKRGNSMEVKRERKATSKVRKGNSRKDRARGVKEIGRQ